MNIKNPILTAIIISIASSLQAQNYQIFKATENVTIKEKQQQQWVTAERRMKVSYPDSLNIDNGGSISLLNSNNNQIIIYDKYGKCRVKNAIDESLREAGNIAAYTTQKLAMAIATKNKTPQYNVYGATMRSRSSKQTMDVNHQMAYHLHDIISTIKKGKQPKSYNKIELSRKYNDDTYHFVVRNNDSKPYVINILRIPQDGDPSFCINFDKSDSEYFFSLIDQQSELEFPSFTFLSDDATYILVATEQVFDASWVENALRGNSLKKQKNNIKTKLFILQ